ncbi:MULTISPECIES: hypothetical protein [unclassified Citrobacter]|nr:MULTISPECIES: hypothetical protein [unclassified Citrobacter]MDM3314136.1 hypothetical protein [Citrobacter sp. Cb220]QLR47915.1 hypothetical protein HV345_12310 [Citrobacter sp. RHBSTW-00986]HCB1678794.1 hypothetical protein [Citrobacter braakii]
MSDNFPFAIFNVKFAPWNDRNQISKKTLKIKFGIVSKKDECPYFNLINIHERLIKPKKRHVHISTKISFPISDERGFRKLIQKMENGEDINSHLSKLIFNTNKNDGMLLDFGLHHFHLGEKIELKKKQKTTSKNDFIDRTGALLVALVRDDDIYCLGVFDHGNDLWINTDLIEIIHAEWPHALDKNRINSVISISPEPNSIDRKKYRDSNFNTIVEVSDGTYYQMLGGGFNAAGSSALAGLKFANNNLTVSLLEYYAPSKIVQMIINHSFVSDKGAIHLKLLTIPHFYQNIIFHEDTGDFYVIGFYETKGYRKDGVLFDAWVEYYNLRYLSENAVYHENFALSHIAAIVIAATKCYKNTNRSILPII